MVLLKREDFGDFLTRERPVSSELVMSAETLPLGIGCWELGLRENKGHGGVWTGERDIET